MIEPYFETKLGKLYHGDCLEIMKQLPDNSIDSIVTDPPYGLSFMGKKWDYEIPSVEIWRECLRVIKPGGHLLSFAGTRTQHRMAVNIEDAGFEIRDMIAWVYGSGFPKSLDISKAIDRMAGAEREIIGVDEWKAARRPQKNERQWNAYSETKYDNNITTPSTPEAKQWKGWGTALKPALEPITLARKPLSEKTVAENVLKWETGGLNIDGGRVEASDIESFSKNWDRETVSDIRGGNFMNSKAAGIKNTKLAPKGRFPANLIHDGSAEVVAGFPDEDDSGSAARFFKQISIDNECTLCYNTCIKDINKESESWKKFTAISAELDLKILKAIKENIAQTNVTLNLSVKAVQLVKFVGYLCDSCAIHIVQKVVEIKTLSSAMESEVMLDFMQDYKKCTLIQILVRYVELMDSIDTTPITRSLLKLFGSVHHAIKNYIPKTRKSEQKRFVYEPKASKEDRDWGLEGFELEAAGGLEGRHDGSLGTITYSRNPHPTVKPVDLMRYLCRLITPPRGTVLDPFTGSGSTGKACIRDSFKFIGIERDEKYCQIAAARIKAESEQGKLF